MGDGSNSPGANTNFDQRKTEPAVGEEDASDGAVGAGSSGDGSGESSIQIKEGQGPFRDQIEGHDPEEWAAYRDFGYNEDAAEYFKQKSTDELEERFEELSTDGAEPVYNNQHEKRFVGGMLASREDSNVSAEDVFEINNNTGQSIGAQFMDVDDDLEMYVKERVQKTLEKMDEYMAGQAASKISTFEIRTLDKDTLGTYDMGSGEIQVSTDANNDRVKAGTEDVVAHEIGHAVSAQYNLDSSGDNNHKKPPQQWEFHSDPPEVVHEQDLDTGSAQKFREGVEELGNKMRDAELGNPTAEIKDSIRRYQGSNSQEMFSVGFGEYMSDFASLANKQPGMVDHIDTHVTKSEWVEASVGELETSGVDHGGMSAGHIPADVESVGELVKVELDGREKEEIVGYATDPSSEENVSVSYAGFEREYPQEDVKSVKRRDW